MLLSKALQDKILDVRLRDKLLAEGKITKAQVDEALKALADDEQNCEYLDNPEKPERNIQ